MSRHFDIGRQGEVLLDKKNHSIYKTMENFSAPPNPNNPASGPAMEDPNRDPISEKALWLDNFIESDNGELKYYHNGQWNIMFKNKFKITDHITDSEKPRGAIQGQLWIDKDGVMHYFDKGIFVPIKAAQADIGDVELQGFDNFIIISPLEATDKRIVDNFSEFLFAETPIVDWNANTKYSKHQGCINDLHIYMAVKDHTSANIEELDNRELWIRLDFLQQYLIPDSNFIKVFVDGRYVHEKIGFPNDPDEEGYTADTNISITLPVEDIDNKLVSGVHVNPRRLKNIKKKAFIIDKKNPIIEFEEEDSEFYVIEDGVGRFLIKTDNPDTTDYISALSNGLECIKLSSRVADRFEFVYAINYEFNSETLVPKEKGVLHKKKIRVNDENYIWVGSVPESRIIVFGQGLHYEKHEDTYSYDSESGYLYIKEKLQDYDNMTKSFDFSVLSLPEVFEGRVANNFHPEYGFRINLEKDPIGTHYIGFAGGVQLAASTLDVIDDPNGNGRVKYIPSLTKDIWDKSGNDMYWAIAATNDTNVSRNSFEMYRGSTTTINKKGVGNVIPIYRDENDKVEGSLHLAIGEKPILFIDGILVFQKEIEIGHDYLTIYGLKEGQEVVMLADTSIDNTKLDDTDADDHINSDRLLFEDTVSFATIPTELCDDTIVFAQDGVLVDSSATYSSMYPREHGSHGEVRYIVNPEISEWIVYDAKDAKWKEVDKSLKYTDPITGDVSTYVNYLNTNLRSYSRTRRSISFIQRLDKQYCTYYAYKYADSIEKRLQMGYCYPDGEKGVNVLYPTIEDPQPFYINFKHSYQPGRNELTVYLNGVRQELNNPSDINFANSTNRECKDRNDNFVLAYDKQDSNLGTAIDEYDGYWIYNLEMKNKYKTLSFDRELSDAEVAAYEADGYNVALASKPSKNVLFYIIEPCESKEIKACDIKKLTWKDANANKGAFADNSYNTGEFLLTRGNLRVFVNGIRQPFGGYQTVDSASIHNRKMVYSYRIVDANTIKFEEVLTGSMGGNESTDENPLFPIGNIVQPDGSSERKYFTRQDEIIIEVRRDYKLREITLPILDNTGEFTLEDGVPADMFKTKDKIAIYINGLMYGNKYIVEDNMIKLIDDDIRQQLATSKKDVITFEWR